MMPLVFSVAVFYRGNAHNPGKYPREIIGIVKAQFCRYLIDSQCCKLKILAGVLDL